MKVKDLIILFGICFFIVVIADKLKNNKTIKQEIPQEIVQEEIKETPVQEEIVQEDESKNILQEESLKYCESYDEALELAKKHKRSIFLYFGAPWCGYCVKMKNETLNDKEVMEKLSKEYVVYIVNTDVDKTTTRKYGISGIPQYLIIDQDETIALKDSGFKPKQDFISWLNPNKVSLLH